LPLTLTWQEVALRLALAMLAGVVFGVNRLEHGRAAGLRTNILVCLAACVAMVQVNLLLALAGKSPSSFVVMDLMRLPLGILSGMGFIGGGAILRKGEMVVGVTTAATLWFNTVVGLCFGGGQIGLGLAAVGLGIFVLWVLKRAENIMPQDHRASLVLIGSEATVNEQEILQRLASEGFSVLKCGSSYQPQVQRLELRCEVQWRDRSKAGRKPVFLGQLAQTPGLVELQWQP
jgi:putative Mg2+ transporter-C (MgtC) family protein